MKERRKKELEEKLDLLTEVKGKTVDAEMCFRTIYPYESRRCPSLKFNGWYLLFYDGFHGIPNSPKVTSNSVYEDGQTAREIVFGHSPYRYQESSEQTTSEKVYEKPYQEKRNKIILRQTSKKEINPTIFKG